MILGTAAYMSPEQAKGRPADTRSDVWAFGVRAVRNAHGPARVSRRRVAEVMASVIKSEPDWNALPSNLSPGLRVCLRRSLDKTLKDRLHAVADLRLAMEGAFDLASGTAVGAGRRAADRAGGDRCRGCLRAFVMGGSTAAARRVAADASRAPRVTRLAVTAPATQPLAVAQHQSRSGHLSGRGQHRVLDRQRRSRCADRTSAESTVARRAPDSAMPSARSCLADSAWVGFIEVIGPNVEENLHPRRVHRSPSVPVHGDLFAARVGGRTARSCLEGALGSLWRVAANGGEPEQITKVDSTRGGQSHSWPTFCRARRAVLFTIVPARTGSSGETAQIALLKLDTGEQRMLIPRGSYPRYAPTGHLVYAVDGALRAAGFDLERLEVTTLTDSSLEGVITKESGAADFAFAADGTLVYLPGRPADSQRTVVWVDQAGREEPLAGTSGQQPSVGPVVARRHSPGDRSGPAARHLDLRYRPPDDDEDHDRRS